LSDRKYRDISYHDWHLTCEFKQSVEYNHVFFIFYNLLNYLTWAWFDAILF